MAHSSSEQKWKTCLVNKEQIFLSKEFITKMVESLGLEMIMDSYDNDPHDLFYRLTFCDNRESAVCLVTVDNVEGITLFGGTISALGNGEYTNNQYYKQIKTQVMEAKLSKRGEIR